MSLETGRPAATAVKNGLSFDVEEYFHALNLRPVAPASTWDARERRAGATTRGLLEPLAARGIQATFFFLGWVARREPELVREVHAAGHEVASHGMSHQMAHELGPEAFRAEARESKALLEDAIGAAVTGFRASTFSIGPRTRWALDVLVEEGYRYDSSIFPVRHDRYGDPAFPRHPVRLALAAGSLVELPMLTLRRFGVNLPAAGGGYLRLLPAGIVHRALREMNASGQPGILYLHPWEFDPGQPRLLRGGLSAWRHYAGLGGTRRKLEGLLDRHAFAPLATLAAAVH